jgi:hypothetical protein
MCEATYFDHMAAEHGLMAAATPDMERRALNQMLAGEYGYLARLLRLSRALGNATEREFEATLLRFSHSTVPKL